MQGSSLNFAIFIFLFSIFFVNCSRMTNNDLPRNIFRNDEIGRLRRGFKSSALATARGFGKRSNQGTMGVLSQNPFMENIAQKSFKMGDRAPMQEPVEFYKNPSAYIYDILQSNPGLSSILESRLGQAEKLNWVPRNTEQENK